MLLGLLCRFCSLRLNESNHQLNLDGKKEITMLVNTMYSSALHIITSMDECAMCMENRIFCQKSLRSTTFS